MKPIAPHRTPRKTPMAGLCAWKQVLLLALVVTPQLNSSSAAAEDYDYAAAVYHFNLQYVAGGLEDFVDDLSLSDVWQGLDYSEAGVEDAIIRESFLPLLQMYQAHPTWGADFELQGLMVDVIRERHPDVLTLMQQLDGQLSFDSFHYSDELWTAQPGEVIQRSREATEAAFAAAGLTLGRAAFTQEGQFGSGMGNILPAGDVAILPRNLFGLHYPEADRRPLFSMGEADVVIGGHTWTQQVGDDQVHLTWTWMDDGELLATNDLDPYFLPSFVHHPESVAQYEEQLEQLETEGYIIAKVIDAVDALRTRGYQPEALPPLIDGAWQPRDTNNLGLWMGDTGFWPLTEADNAVRSNWHRSFAQLRAADSLIAAGIAQRPEGGLDAAWQELFLAGVSDATGWNPYRSEVAYSLAHAAAASEAAQQVFDSMEMRCEDCMLRVPWDRDEVEVVSNGERDRAQASPILEGVEAGTSSSLVTAATSWFTDPFVANATGLSVSFSGSDTAALPGRWIDIPLATGELRFLPAGGQELISVPLSLFAAAEEPIGLPLANGILGLGDERYLVLDPRTMMLAARVHPEQDYVRFVDHSAATGPGETWELYFTSGEQRALSLSQQLVQRPDLWFAPAPPLEESGCSCAVSTSRSYPQGTVLLLLLALTILPRARRRR
jgi:hypothetical protein